MDDAAAIWPVKTREVVNAYQDSRRWDGFAFRDGDVVVATWAKTGTTWTQQIVWQLIHSGPEGLFDGIKCPWVDARFAAYADMIAGVENQSGRRDLKTHLPLDALVFSPLVKYIYVGRDARDVAWSSYNHQAGYSDQGLAWLNGLPDRIGPPAARPRETVREYYLDFLERDEWEGYGDNPFWDHVQGWWDARRLPNVRLVHFDELKADLEGEARRIAQFLEIDVPEDDWPRILEHCSFDYMRERAAAAGHFDSMWQDGAKSFFKAGVNGRWKDVLSAEEIALCDAVAARLLTPECAHWLKTGELPADDH